MSLKLSEHFTYEEMTFSEYAARNGIRNIPTREVIANLRRTCGQLEIVRKLLGNRPIMVSSGYRSPELNKAIGGSATSAHMDGRAVDFTVPGLSVREVCDTLSVTGINYDQLIYEFGRWIHLGFAKEGVPARVETLQILKPGKYEPYVRSK